MDRVARAPDAVWRRTSRRVVVIPPRGDVVELPGIAALVWDLLDDERSVADVASELAAVFEVDAVEAITTVQEVVRAAVDAGAMRLR